MTSKVMSDKEYLEQFKTSCRENIKILMTVTPMSVIFRSHMRNYSHLLNCSTVVNMGDWGNEGLMLIADGVLSEKTGRDYDGSGKVDNGLILNNKDSIK
jgi:hypothetical protein